MANPRKAQTGFLDSSTEIIETLHSDGSAWRQHDHSMSAQLVLAETSLSDYIQTRIWSQDPCDDNAKKVPEGAHFFLAGNIFSRCSKKVFLRTYS